MTPTRILLKPGREKSLRLRHPWVFSGAIARVEGSVEPGQPVEVLSSRGEWLACGDYNPRSQIALRLLTFHPDEAVEAAFWRRRLLAALARRRETPGLAEATARRLVYAESDGLPGLIVDQYGEWLVLQALTLGMEQRKGEIVALLQELLAPRSIYERSDVDVRAQEGLSQCVGPLAGEEPPDIVEITEDGLRFCVDLRRGHKTGFYLDQRENRRAVARYCTEAVVLNAFAYTGGFAVHALRAGARRVTNLDSSAEALRVAADNLALNGLSAERAEQVEGDAFQVLRAWRDAGRTFGVVILDPPKFAFSRAQLNAATRGYKDINMLAMRLLRPGGVLCTFSCSGLVSEDLFQKVVFGACLDVGREVRILQRLSQGPDHPVALTFPEGAYLKGLICRVE